MTTTYSAPGFIGLDFETTGLIPDDDIILEMGIVLFDSNLEPIAHRSWITAGARFRADIGRPLDPVVSEMHTTSGLLDEIMTDTGVSEFYAESSALGFLEEHGAVGWPMLGSSVSFERAFLAHRMPALGAAIHYRSLDATSVGLARLAATPAEFRASIEGVISNTVDELLISYRADLGLDRPHRPHRAIDDVLYSAALAFSAILATDILKAEVF